MAIVETYSKIKNLTKSSIPSFDSVSTSLVEDKATFTFTVSSILHLIQLQILMIFLTFITHWIILLSLKMTLTGPQPE